MTFLSIVTGTHNRLDYLRGVVQSVREQLPVGMSYEIVVVDGDSRDGTIDWCNQQSDVVLIQHHGLLGAIKAFCDGARAAQGEYVLLANDDILFHGGSILKSIVHLETHPDCGAVAFKDNRQGNGYQIQYVPATTSDGQSVSVPYAQVGLYRRWLGDLALWWGDTDPIMQTSRTYGGDNFLSARIWEMGYTVESVEGCAVDDRIPDDDLRRRNVAYDSAKPSPYHLRYPSGVLMDSLPKPQSPQAEQLRILYLPLFSEGYGRYKHGLFDALSKVGWVYELDYLGQRAKVAGAVRDFQPHLILTQLHGADVITPSALEALRTYAPNAVVANWSGDVYVDQLLAPEMLELLKHVDLQLVVNADVLPAYEFRGIQAAYWQIAAEPVPDELPHMPRHDIVFQANAYSPARKELASVLGELSKNVGIYGAGWDNPTGSTFYDFARGAALYRNCKIAIGDNQYQNAGFVSNRLFEALANGAFLLHQRIPGIEELTGVAPGVHFVEWLDLDDLRAKVNYYLTHEDARRSIAMAGELFVRTHHSFDARVAELFEVHLPKVNSHEPRSHERLETMADIVGAYGHDDGIVR